MNTKFANSILIAGIFTIAVSAFAAEMQPLSPVANPPVAIGSPEVKTNLPPLSGSIGLETPLNAPTLSTTPIPVPAAPSGVPTKPSATMLPEGTPPPMTAPPADVTPIVSQPLRPVSPQTISETERKIEQEGIQFNTADADIREVLKEMSRTLGKNFLVDDKLKGKITIISERKMTKDELWEAFLSSLDSLGYTIVQGPAGLLKVVPVKEALNRPIELYTENSPFSDRFITRLITPKNISAADMANVIKGMVSKDGNLFAYPVTNTLILTDTGTNIDRLIKLMNELDQEGPQEVLEIIPVTYASAKEIADKITQVFEVEKSSTPSAQPIPAPKGGKGSPEPTSAGEEVPKLRKVIADDRTNSLLVLASKRAIQRVRDLIKRLDSPMTGDEGHVHVYYLKHATAKDMATVINAISGAVQQSKDQKKTGAPGSPAAAADANRAAVQNLMGGAEFSGKFTVNADESTNALVITANAKDYNTLIEQVISKLDIPRRQVYVEAVVVELSVSQDQDLGAGILGGKNFNVSGNELSVFGSTFGFLDPSKLLSGSVGGVSDKTIGLNLPGVTGSGSASTQTVPAFFSALQFVQGNTDINILSTPNLLTLDNQEAEIKVGQKVPFPAASATTIGASVQTTFTREDVALSLKIKPQINEGGNVRLEVTQEDREVLPLQEQPSNASQAGPTTTERSIKTAIVAVNGQTVVLGGLIKDKYANITKKVPLLGDVPILGYLFKTKTKTKQKVNLLVFLTPHIIQEPKDFLVILQKKINEQNEFIANNFSKAQQKQIKASLESHASRLLDANSEDLLPKPIGSSFDREEDSFPMTDSDDVSKTETESPKKKK